MFPNRSESAPLKKISCVGIPVHPGVLEVAIQQAQNDFRLFIGKIITRKTERTKRMTGRTILHQCKIGCCCLVVRYAETGRRSNWVALAHSSAGRFSVCRNWPLAIVCSGRRSLRHLIIVGFSVSARHDVCRQAWGSNSIYS